MENSTQVSIEHSSGFVIVLHETEGATAHRSGTNITPNTVDPSRVLIATHAGARTIVATWNELSLAARRAVIQQVRDKWRKPCELDIDAGQVLGFTLLA